MGSRPSDTTDSDSDTAEVLASRAIMYTPEVHTTPQNIERGSAICTIGSAGPSR
ncbi:hypothetical protein GCM10009678_53500 [Actinomadura kijaniata]|uniref:Uncharacterized protein n=1 Tax=Actinomadura namibiensis TaxID=182080 RepID=A0A7W3LRQ5_ACTNM|nr:hypothetical protein [Actinomadura namibiensis]